MEVNTLGGKFNIWRPSKIPSSIYSMLYLDIISIGRIQLRL